MIAHNGIIYITGLFKNLIYKEYNYITKFSSKNIKLPSCYREDHLVQLQKQQKQQLIHKSNQSKKKQQNTVNCKWQIKFYKKLNANILSFEVKLYRNIYEQISQLQTSNEWLLLKSRNSAPFIRKVNKKFSV